MKTFIFILSGGLFLFQTAFSSGLSLVGHAAKTVTSEKKIKMPPRTVLIQRKSVTRSLAPVIPCCIDNNELHIYFDTPIQNRYLQVVDADSGEVIYFDVFSGTVLIIPLTVVSENYTVEIM